MKHNIPQIIETRKIEVAHRTNPIHATDDALVDANDAHKTCQMQWAHNDQ